jgi:hypothetical protein
MTAIRRRLQRIEAVSRAASTLGAERHAAVKSLALEHLSNEDLDALEDIVGQETQANQWTQREAGAVKALTTAFEQEVQKAGYATIRKFQRSCGVPEV